MGPLASLAATFQVTEFDIGLLGLMALLTLILYYYISLHRIFEAAFGAIIWLGIYILLSVVLVGNPLLGAEGWLFPLGFSVFLVSISVYLVFVLAFLFPLHGGLVIAEPTQPTLYSLLYFLVCYFLLFILWAICIYMIEQSYVFRVWNILTWIKDTPFYTMSIKPSWFYTYVIGNQNLLIPLGVVLMLYKLLLSNIINAALLSIWYNLANVGFYRAKDDAHYRVEFHEVGGHGGWHGTSDDAHAGWHGDAHGHDAHGGNGWHH